MSNSVLRHFDIEDAYPMTKLQKGMLFYSEYNAGEPVYHDILTYHLKGIYNIKALQEAVQYMIARHPALRTSFNLSDFSEPVQIVQKEAIVIIGEADLRNSAESYHADIRARWLEEEKKKDFDWKLAPLFRLQTHRWKEDEFDISLSYHHSILDGVSAFQMMIELFGVYLNKLGKANYLPEPMEYNAFRDYVALELGAVKSETCKDYWLKKLEGLACGETIYQDSIGSGYKTEIVEISPEMLNALKALARYEAVPLNVILLAAHLSVLSIITGEFDVVTGLVTSGKPEDIDADRELGLFANTVPLRIQLTGGTWKQLVRQVFDAEQEMMTYRRYPLAEITKHMGNSQFFESIFSYVNFNVYKNKEELSDYLKIIDVNRFERTNYPLASQFWLDISGNKLSLQLIYDSDRFRDQQMAGAGKIFTRIFLSMLQSMDNLYISGKTVKYWQNNFKGALSIYNMRTDYALTQDQEFKSDEVQFSADRLTRTVLLELGRQYNTSLYSVILSIFNVFLYKYTGQNDAALWAPIAGTGLIIQKNKDVHPHYLAMKHEIKNEEMFSQHLMRVRDGVSEALDCQDIIFEDLIVNHLIGSRVKNAPLYNVLFSLKTDSSQAAGYSNKLGDYTLALDVVESNEEILFTLRYNNTLFAQETVNRMKTHLQNIVEQVISNPDMLVKEITLITNSERDCILNEFNNTSSYYDREKTIHRFLEEQAGKTPAKIAVLHKGQKLTYGDLNSKANRLARVLRRKGVKPNSIVGIMMERSLEMLIGIFAILKAGGAYMPIDPKYPRERIRYMLQDSEAIMLVTKDKTGNNILFEGEVLDITDDPGYKEDDGNLEQVNSSRDLVYVIYTSGSTGNPKGVMIEHHSLVNQIQWMRKIYPIDESDIILQKTPLTFDVSLWELFWWSIAGASVVLLEPDGEKDPDMVLNAVFENKVTVMHFVPSMFNGFLNYIEIGNHFEKLSSLKLVLCSGEALALKHVQMFNRITGSHGIRLVNLYGPTEATVHVSYYECIWTDEHLSMIPIGRPVDNTNLYIVGSNYELMPVGITGELCIAGVGLARGYVNNKELSEEKFVRNPFYPGERMYRTGDLARWKADGNIEFLGRMDNQIKLRGYRIELGEIESVLRQHPDVQDAVVTIRQIKSNEMNQKLVAYVVLKGVNRPTPIQLQIFSGKKLPDYMIPEIIMVLDSIPLTSSGKANTKALPEPDYANIRGDAQYAEATNPTEKALVDIWSRVLAVKRVGIDDNYFSLGGDSILSIQIMALAKKHGLNVTIRNLCRYPTIRGLSANLAELETSHADDVVGEAFDLISRQDRMKLAGYKM